MPYLDFKLVQMGKKKLLNRRKTDPGQFTFTGIQKAAQPHLQLFEYSEEVFEETDAAGVAQTVAAIQKGATNCWVNLNGLHDESTIVAICKALGIHNLVIQDILDVNQRPKFQAFESFNFFTIKSVVPHPTELEMEQISFVMGQHFLISFQEHSGDFFDHLRFRLRSKVGLLRSRGVDFLLFTLLEAILDNYFKTLQEFENQTEFLNQLIKAARLQQADLDALETLKRKVHVVRKAIMPIKDFTANAERGECTFIEPRHIKYFLEIKDLCLTLLDNAETIDKQLESATNRYFSLQNHKLNQVMKTLTVVSTVFIPLTFIAGIYGMNFQYMPELSWPFGYGAVLGLMAIIAATILLVFKKQRWL